MGNFSFEYSGRRYVNNSTHASLLSLEPVAPSTSPRAISHNNAPCWRTLTAVYFEPLLLLLLPRKNLTSEAGASAPAGFSDMPRPPPNPSLYSACRFAASSQSSNPLLYSALTSSSSSSPFVLACLAACAPSSTRETKSINSLDSPRALSIAARSTSTWSG